MKNLLRLYVHERLWCFDFPALGIVAEPFVEGIEEIISEICRRELGEIPEVVVLEFDTLVNSPLRHRLRWIARLDRGEEVWHRYELESIAYPPLRGNLCPVLGMFFPEPPDLLNFQIWPATPEWLHLAEAFSSAPPPSLAAAASRPG